MKNIKICGLLVTTGIRFQPTAGGLLDRLLEKLCAQTSK